MNTRRLFRTTAWLLGFGLLLGLSAANGEQAPPKENKGMKAESLASLDLGSEIEGMQGRQLRMRILTLEPGGVLAIHSHKDRPSVARVLQGTWTELREGGLVKDHQEGESWAEGKETVHWAENRGTKPAVLLVVDVFKTQ